jgi:GH25 family lysozyme M1 (1,4-beta-N-acetylmuramidase)
MSRKVLDISGYDPSINLATVAKNGISGVIIKATESTGYRNPYFERQVSAAKAAGLEVGFYHFSRPSAEAGDAVREADAFLAKTGIQKVGLGYWLDVEATSISPAATAAWVKAFVERVEAKTGRTPGLYTGSWFWEPRVSGTVALGLGKLPLWLSGYTSKMPHVPAPWKQATFWQFTSSYKIAGSPRLVDCSVFLGTDAQWDALLNRRKSVLVKTSTKFATLAAALGVTVAALVSLNGGTTAEPGRPVAVPTVKVAPTAPAKPTVKPSATPVKPSPKPTPTKKPAPTPTKPSKPAPEPIHKAPKFPGKSVVSYGKRNASVKLLQAGLNKHGAKLPVTGYFGDLTKKAVKAYQAKHVKSLGPADGVVGPKTWGSLLG